MKENKQKYSIRKFSVGVSSIVIASLLFIGAGTTHVEASEQNVQNNGDKVDTTVTGKDQYPKVDIGQQKADKNTNFQDKTNNADVKDAFTTTKPNNERTNHGQQDGDINLKQDEQSEVKSGTQSKQDLQQNSQKESQEPQQGQTKEQVKENTDFQTKDQTKTNKVKDNEQGNLSSQQPKQNKNIERSNNEALKSTKTSNDSSTKRVSNNLSLHNKKNEQVNDDGNVERNIEDIKSEQDLLNKSDELSTTAKEKANLQQDSIKSQTVNGTQTKRQEPVNTLSEHNITSHDENTSANDRQDEISYDSLEEITSKGTVNYKDSKMPNEGIKSLKNNAVATTNTKTTQRESENVSAQPGKKAKQGEYKNQDPIILVHGFNGFTDDINPVVLSHYWGGDKLNITQDLEQNGYKAYEASIGALSSNYDRAVELYYYIKGGRVDYGAAHSAKYGHERYGKTYDGVYKDWQPGQKVHLVGHSMGGQTVRQLEELLRNGNQEEIEYQKEHGGTISPLFQGNHDNMISSITTLGTPHNGTHAADELGNEAIVRQAVYDFVKLRSNKITNVNFGLDQWGLKQRPDETFIDYAKRVKEMSKIWTTKDNGLYDLTREGATELNRNTSINPNIVYKTYTGEATHPTLLGKQRADLNLFLPFTLTSNVIGKAKEQDWRENDGLVSVISSQHPFNQSYTNATDKVQKGVWQVTPVRHGWDHVDFVGQDTLDTSHSKQELQDFWLDLAADLVRDEKVT